MTRNLPYVPYEGFFDMAVEVVETTDKKQVYHMYHITI